MDARRTAVVTGATSGLGEAAAIAIARRGWRVIVVGRDATRGRDVVARARAAGGEAELVTGELFTIDGARRVAEGVRRLAPRIDVLINNAGGTFARTERTSDGLERTVALNLMAPFVLSEELRPQLAAARGRIVNVVTGILNMARTTLDQLFGERARSGMQQYVRAKLALLALGVEQQRRYAADGITVVSLHPGVILETRFAQQMPAFFRVLGPLLAWLFRFASTLEEAAARYLEVALGEVQPGGFYWKAKRTKTPRQAADPAFATELWQVLSRRTTELPPSSSRVRASTSSSTKADPDASASASGLNDG